VNAPVPVPGLSVGDGLVPFQPRVTHVLAP
jgi:hypothetical protein